MPNWFYLTLEVNGSRKDVEEFVDNVQGSKKNDTEELEFDFNHFIPQPNNIFKESVGSDKKQELNEQGIPNWYDWNIENWGTKWNATCDVRDIYYSSEEDVSSVRYGLSTAWADPRPILHKMIEMYPQLHFTIEGEEESTAYGIYINTSEDVFLEEEPTMTDDMNGKEVYWKDTDSLYYYMDNDEIVPDQEDFYPSAKYSWN